MNSKNYLVVAECAIECEEKFLLIQRPEHEKHAGGLLSFPGGKIEEQDEHNEHDILRSAVKREVEEEVGIIIDFPLTYITSTFFTNYKGTPIIDSIFHCWLPHMPEVKASPREVHSYYWMDQEEINNSYKAAWWLKEYITMIKGAN